MTWYLCSKKEFPLLATLLCREEKRFFHIVCELFNERKLLFPPSDHAFLFYLSEKPLTVANDLQSVMAVLLYKQTGELYLCSYYTLSEEKVQEAYNFIEQQQLQWNTFFSIPRLSPKNEQFLQERVKTTSTPLEIHSYQLMFYDFSCHHFNRLLPKKERISGTSKPFSISFNHTATTEQLQALHTQYLLAEVATPLRPITLERGNKISLSLLQNQLIAGAYEGEKLIGKVNTNLKGIHVVQLGGIFTLLESRNKGVASALLKAIIKRLQPYFDHIALFVRQENLIAQKVYEKVGFKVASSLGIYYH